MDNLWPMWFTQPILRFCVGPFVRSAGRSVVTMLTWFVCIDELIFWVYHIKSHLILHSLWLYRFHKQGRCYSIGSIFVVLINNARALHISTSYNIPLILRILFCIVVMRIKKRPIFTSLLFTRRDGTWMCVCVCVSSLTEHISLMHLISIVFSCWLSLFSHSSNAPLERPPAFAITFY